MDGSRTPRSEMARKVGQWVGAPEQEALWQSRPIKGEVGIVFVPEAQLWNHAQQGNTEFFAKSMQGAYQGFFDVNVQPDWVRIEHIDEYAFLYLPYPVMLSQETADKLRAWVEAGGTLVAEGCPGYFDDRGHVGPVQPNLGLDELFGVRESYVEFVPDLLGDLQVDVGGNQVRGGVFLQAYEPTTGTAVGWYEDNRVATVDNVCGKGRTRLLGTMAGYGYATHPDDRSPSFFAELMQWAGREQHVACSDGRVKARLHDGEGGTYLWVANPTREPLPVRLTLSQAWGPFSSCQSLWGTEATVEGRTVTLAAGARDVAVIALA
jgi:beta-galactosidase